MLEATGRLFLTIFLLFVAGMIVTSIQGGEIYALVVGAAVFGAGYVLLGGGE